MRVQVSQHAQCLHWNSDTSCQSGSEHISPSRPYLTKHKINLQIKLFLKKFTCYWLNSNPNHNNLYSWSPLLLFPTRCMTEHNLFVLPARFPSVHWPLSTHHGGVWSHGLRESTERHSRRCYNYSKLVSSSLPFTSEKGILLLGLDVEIQKKVRGIAIRNVVCSARFGKKGNDLFCELKLSP